MVSPSVTEIDQNIEVAGDDIGPMQATFLYRITSHSLTYLRLIPLHDDRNCSSTVLHIEHTGSFSMGDTTTRDGDEETRLLAHHKHSSSISFLKDGSAIHITYHHDGRIDHIII
eukprot:CAMPEP_0194049400 /NCGR_PEP_ID=MMETSP0009_2-20130614/30625_1 /TAXON_ID=210454 /ORGANISM="Grammatophora oceanica, Strain CCMP 410" /LENGTH=113 /DNA_ID=CAMNT_0038695549 /DNA_START=192 /DNA_END=534 /DNA_ORIENTATION=+